MKKYTFIALICLIPLLVFADIDTFVGQTGIDTWVGQTGLDTVVGQTIAGGGGPDVWYDSPDLCATTQALSEASAADMSVTATTGGTITHVRVRVSSVDDASNLKATLYYWDGDSWEKHSNETVESIGVGWVTFTLASGYTVGDSEEVKVIFVPDDSATFCADDDVNSGGYDAAFGYEDSFEQTYTQDAPYKDFNIGVYVD